VCLVLISEGLGCLFGLCSTRRRDRAFGTSCCRRQTATLTSRLGSPPFGRWWVLAQWQGWIDGNGGPGRRSGTTLGGALQLVNNDTINVSQSSRLYHAFQLNTTQSLPWLINAVGQQGKLSNSNNILPVHQDMVSTTGEHHSPSNRRS
ncbi:hypothetical protein Taro_033082, partial [Colocasia esculenta]|nr:hypothetical protein [Colocasia esculenta]